MIISRTYMGEHIFGKRNANKNRKLIPRPVVCSQNPSRDRNQQLRCAT
jgi:hypothetical protein